MPEKSQHHFAPESAKAHLALKNTLVKSSKNLAWTSCLLDHVEGDDYSDVHETTATGDLTVVVATHGEHDVEVFSGGRWRQAIYQVGSTGLTPAGETTRLRWKNRLKGVPFRTAHLYIPGSFFTEAAELYRKPGQSLSADIGSKLVISDQIASSVVTSLLSAIDEEAPDIYAETAVRWLAMHLLSSYREKHSSGSGSQRWESLSDKRLGKAIEYMTENLSRAMSVDEIAREALISPFHFTRLFREKVGLTPHKFLTAIRLDKARTLLSTTDLPISVIGAECGYPVASSFSAAFSREFKMAPNEFAARKNVKQ